jgi:hypothetical protein
MGIFCDRSSVGDRSLEIRDPWDGQPVGRTFISGAERSRQIGLAGMGRPQITTIFVEEQDRVVNPAGVKGLGELPIVGAAAAIANPVYHATGVRVRDLPIRPEKILV